MVRWVVGSILHGGPASATQVVQERLWYVISCLWDGALHEYRGPIELFLVPASAPRLV